MEFLRREMYLRSIRPFYDSDLIKILVGMRRCGKSTIMKQIVEEIKLNGISDDNIICINFEELKYRNLCDAVPLEEYVASHIAGKGRTYVFLDEIQKVNGFEDAINSLRATNDCSIFITGSNGKLLSSELKTELTGRYVEFKIRPFTFRETKEFLSLNGRKSDFKDYMRYGGLPQRFAIGDENGIKTYLSDVYDSIVARDIVERFRVKDPEILLRITDYLVDNSSRLFSVNNVVGYLRKNNIPKSTETVYNYVSYAVSSLIVDRVKRFDTKGKKILSSTEKYYAADPGIRNIRSLNASSDIGVTLELIVYNELVARGYDVIIGVTSRSEIDFIISKSNTKSYIQVTYLLSDENIMKREFGSLEELNDNYPKYVLSMDEFDLSRNGIKHLNIVDFLLSDEF